jgi:hypothetical protein
MLRRRDHSRTRDALAEAREIYRRRSGAAPAPDADADSGAGAGAGAEPQLPAAPKRRRALARRIVPQRPAPTPPAASDAPDVHLDVSRLHVDRVDLKVDELAARVALQAHVLDLLRLDVGVDADLRGVSLEIDGVDAQAELDVRLEHLTTIVDRVMSTIDRNPQLLEHLIHRLSAAVNDLGSTAARAIRPGLNDDTSRVSRGESSSSRIP